MNKNICVTLGDPNGLGPELICRLFAQRKAERAFLMIGPENGIEYHLEKLGMEKFYTVLDDPAKIAGAEAGYYLYCPDVLKDFKLMAGEADPEGGRAAGESLETAMLLLNDKIVSGLVTCPLNKAMLQLAGFDFPGHTEFLANRSGVGRENVCMHLGGPKLKVSLVTTHPRFVDIPKLITKERILRCIDLTDKLVKSLGLEMPVAICGLNPHAGESGRIGSEEIEIIEPAIMEARELGYNVEGPFPGDTIFHFAAGGSYSAVLAMYHDQGLAPLKLLHFSEAVNITLGLPFPRTSPDHGTGYDITGTGKACLDSFEAAVNTAEMMIDT
ncbi:4-hydroxythreonine-4-phosphate dehydrogenase PdxA [Maridesulfovibrio hydrothermalis]|uniref:4-hydroxythreonine-4-phosphate dehydrogenase n=1 Tax=Maridesulfovibrio hydrothermalis AM13 = DSM 14728 TaxID=1121451 RepID=L0RAZ0_9BACT|nr:4-hydroxythreonine-4-phosphate dehydrogenase PdxA [Maridesulfovibrio hydrothermalis]CCO23928.1 4-hydroxythreonine-4-phosphate dehydrogenase [Maridesulfovibrio hydrothermalis AM13 = DSM 14728]